MKGVQDVAKPTCQSGWNDGNIYALIGKVVATLNQANQESQADEFARRVVSAESYDEVLRLSQDYVDFE